MDCLSIDLINDIHSHVIIINLLNMCSIPRPFHRIQQTLEGSFSKISVIDLHILNNNKQQVYNIFLIQYGIPCVTVPSPCIFSLVSVNDQKVNIKPITFL